MAFNTLMMDFAMGVGRTLQKYDIKNIDTKDVLMIFRLTDVKGQPLKPKANEAAIIKQRYLCTDTIPNIRTKEKVGCKYYPRYFAVLERKARELFEIPNLDSAIGPVALIHYLRTYATEECIKELLLDRLNEEGLKHKSYINGLEPKTIQLFYNEENANDYVVIEFPNL